MVQQMLASREEFGRLLDIVISMHDLTPQRWNTYEPIKRMFDFDDVVTVMDAYNLTFLWKRKKPDLLGCVFGDKNLYGKRQHALISIEADGRIDAIRLFDFIVSVSQGFGLHFSYIHQPCMAEIEVGKANGTMIGLMPGRKDLALGLSSHALRRYIPNLYWLTVFGKPYVELFGRESLLSSPVFRVSELETGCIALQLTPDIHDIHADYDAFDELRRQVKGHLNSNAFFQPNMRLRHRYDVPDFGLTG